MAERIISKRCSKCKDTKSISEFHKYKKGEDGLQSYCKSCQKFVERKYRKTARGKEARRKGVKKYKKTAKGKVANKRYQQSKKGKAVFRAAIKRFYARNQNQTKATHAVNNAIQAGKLPRPDTLTCHYYLRNPVCEKQAKQYHHPNYEPENWLKVEPVCNKCHPKTK